MVEMAHREDSRATVLGIVTLVLALLAVSVLVCLPAISNLILSFKEFDMVKGLIGSKWVGLQNYLLIFNSESFTRSVIWTLEYSALSSLTVFLMSQATGYLIQAAGRIHWLRHGLCTLLLLPLAIPGEWWGYAFIKLFSAPGTLNLPLLAFWGSLKYLGLPALLVSAAISHGRRHWSVPLLAGGSIALLLFALLGRFDFNYMHMLTNPMQVGSLLDVYIPRLGVLNNRYSLSSAVTVLRSVLGGILMLAAAWPMAAILKRLFPAGCNPDGGCVHERLLSLPIPGVAVLAATVALAISASAGDVHPGILQSIAVLPIQYIAALFSATASTVLCFLLARPLVTGEKASKTVMAILLILLTAAAASPITIGGYLLARNLRLIDTFFALAFSGAGSVWGVWALAFAAKGMGVTTNADWFRRMWKPAVALFYLQWIFQMNNSLPSYLYITRRALQHPLLLVSQAGVDGNLPNVALLALATLAVPVALLLVVRTAFRDEESLGLFLPGR